MKYFLILLCLSTVSAQTGWNKFIFWGKGQGLVRSGLLGGFDLKGGSGQTISNLVAGGNFITLGATGGSESTDPTRNAEGLIFDGVDDYATVTIPISAANSTLVWVTKTNNSSPGVIVYGGFGTACNGQVQTYYASTSAGNAGRCGESGAAALSGSLGDYHTLTQLTKGYTTTAYLNGTFLSTYTGTSPAPLDANDLTIGSQGAVLTFPYAGTISYLLVYNRQLSPKEIRQNHLWLQREMKKVGVNIP